MTYSEKTALLTEEEEEREEEEVTTDLPTHHVGKIADFGETLINDKLERYGREK